MTRLRFIGAIMFSLSMLAGLGAAWPAGAVLASPPARQCGNANVSIGSPQGGSPLQGQVAITGSASLPGGDFRYYKVQYAPAGSDQWVDIVSGVTTPVQNGVLATLNADQLPPGDYSLRLMAVDPTGNYCEAYSSPLHVANAAQGTPTPGSTPTADPTQIAQALATQVPINPTPTLVIDVPTTQPGSDPLLSKSASSAAAPSILPLDQINTVTSSAGAFAGQLGHFFVFGIQLTAGIFLFLGVIAFLRNNL